MKFPLLPLALLVLTLAGCQSMEMPGSARYFSNQPDGQPFFKVTSGMGSMSMAVLEPGGTWTPPRAMKAIGTNDPPLSTVPGLAAMVQSAYRVDDYVFLELRADAQAQGKPVPSRYFLLPGGFAYPVQPVP